MTTRILFGLVLLALIFSATASAQTQLVNISGAPCTYKLSGISGNTGCDGSGTCSPQLITGPATIAAGWNEEWPCGSGFVDARGSLVVALNNSLPFGLSAYGYSTVEIFYPGGLSITTRYSGQHYVDCSGFDLYSGPYSYSC